MNDRQREYERLIAPIEDRMMRAVWRITGDATDADDALQEALLTVWKRWERIARHPNPHALILHICVNAAHDVLRRRVRHGKWVEEGAVAEAVADPAAPVVHKIACDEERAQVMRAIARLPRNQARAILLHAVEEIPYVEIAAAMDCRESTVRKHVERARVRLRELLSHLIPVIRREETSNV